MANLETTAQITKLLQDQNKLFSAQSKLMKGNLAVMQAMAGVMAGLPAKEISDNFAKANEAIKDADKAIQQATSSTTNLDAASKKASDSNKILGTSFENIAKKAMTVSIAMEGWNKFKGTLSVIGSSVSSIIDIFSTLGSVLLDIGASIISAPFKMLGGLIESAGQGGGGEFRQAVEDIRKEFGQLATNESQAVIKGFRNIRGDLAETGISARRIFGNMAERLKAVTELAMKMGPAFSSLQESFKDPTQMERMAAYQKGLGLTDVGIKGLADRALVTGKSFDELGRDITNFAYKVGPAFGINGKIVARDVGEMSADIKNFGNLGVKTMTSIAVYTRKLGMEAKDLQGIIDKFTDFESAAEAAALLSQSFGMNIDAMAMMKEQDPAKQLSMLRDEFLKTGRDVTTLNRAERSLLATQAGLSDDQVLKAFSKQGMSYDKVGKEAEKAAKRQLSQAEAMDKLAMSIERLVKSGGGVTGFWDAFTKGINRGIVMSKEFREMHRAVQRALNATMMAGMQVGHAIVEFWPGVKQVFAGVRDIFKEIGSFTNKLKIKGFMKDVATEIRNFLSGKSSPEAFFEAVRTKFTNIFNFNSPAIKGMVQGAKDMFKFLSKIMAAGLKIAIKEVTGALNGAPGIFAALRKGPKSAEWAAVFGTASKIKDGFMGFLGEILTPFIEIWNDPKLIKDFNSAFFGLVDEMWKSIKMLFDEHIWPKITKFWNENWGTIVMASSAVIFGPAIISMLIASMMKGVVMLMGNFVSKAAPVVSKGFSSLFGSAGSKIADELSNTESVAKAAEKFDWKGAAVKVGIMMLAIVGIATALAAAYKILDISLGDMDMAQIIKLSTVLLIGTTSLVPVACAMALLSKMPIDAAAMGKTALAVAALGAVAMAMAGTFSGMKYILGTIDINDVKKVNDVIGVMAKAFASAAGVIVVSGVLAGVVALTGGIGAAAIAAGFAGLSAVVFTMVGTAVGIINIINKANVDASFKQKAEAIGIVVGFFTNISQAMMPLFNTSIFDSLASLIKGKNTIEEKIRPVKDFIQKIFLELKDTLNIIAGTPISTTQMEQVSVISKIMESIVMVAKYATPPPELLGNSANTRANLQAATKHTGDMLSTLSTYLPNIIDGLIEAISKLKGVPSGAVETFGKIISSIMPVIQMITPAASLIEAFKEGTKTTALGIGGIITDKTAVDMTKMGESFKIVGGAISGFIKEGAIKGGWIDSLITTVSTLPTLFKGKDMKSGMKSLDTLTTAVDSMKHIITTFAGFGKDFGYNAVVEAADTSKAIFSGFNSILDPINLNMPTIKTAFINMDKNIQELKTGHIEIVAASLTGMIKSINDTKQNLATLLSSPLNISAELGKVANKLGIKDKSEFTIKHNDINITVQLNLKVDAEQFTAIMLETASGKTIAKAKDTK